MDITLYFVSSSWCSPSANTHCTHTFSVHREMVWNQTFVQIFMQNFVKKKWIDLDLEFFFNLDVAVVKTCVYQAMSNLIATPYMLEWLYFAEIYSLSSKVHFPVHLLQCACDIRLLYPCSVSCWHVWAKLQPALPVFRRSGAVPSHDGEM